MTGNSLESLLAWLQDTSQLHEWDALMAVSAARVNQGLQQEYANRLSRGETGQVPAIEVPIPDTPFTHYLEGMTLGAPAFTLDRASLDSADVQLRLPVQGGSDTLVAARLGERNIVRLTAWDPLNRPNLQLHVQAEAATDSQGLLQVQVDPASAGQATLAFAGTPAEQREAGRQLLAWLQAQPPGRRAWPVLAMAGQGNPMTQGATVQVRTQANPQGARNAEGDRDGVLLLFVGMEHGQRGGIPGDNAGFRYLLPDDADYSATALFSSHLLHRAALAAAAQGLLEQGRFDYQPASGLAQRMLASSGSLAVPATTLSGEDIDFECQPFTLQVAGSEQPLAVAFDYTGARQTWQLTCQVPLRYRTAMAGSWQAHEARFRVRVEFEFHLAAESSARLGMQGHLFVPYGLREEAEHLGGLPALPADTLAQLQGLVAMAVKRALLARYSESLRIDASQHLLAATAVSGGLSLQPAVQALPYDQALFGRLADLSGSWQIVGHPPLIAAGERLQMQVEPPREGLLWSVQNPPGSGGDPGHIDADGLYHAPPAHALGAPARSVLISANDPVSGEWHFALLGLVGRAVSVDPLIQVCAINDAVALSARALGDAPLRWAIRDPVAGESGTLELTDPQGRTCRYSAGPQVPDKDYVLDQIEVSDPASGASQSAWMLVRQTEPSATIHPDPDPAAGQVQLRVLISGREQQAQWRLAANSPGSISQDGLYSADPGAAQAFALIFAKGSRLGGTFEQHIILPLPLAQSPALLQALAQP